MSDIVERLKQVASIKDGGPIPDDLGPNVWGGAINKLCADAALAIECLRADVVLLRSMAGSVSSGPAFAEIKNAGTPSILTLGQEGYCDDGIDRDVRIAQGQVWK